MKPSVTLISLVSSLALSAPLQVSAKTTLGSPSAINQSLSKETEALTHSISNSLSRTDQVKLLTAFKAFVDRERSAARAALEKAEKGGASQTEIDRLEQLDSEVVRLHLAFETVFEDVMTKAFDNDLEYRKRTCTNAPKQIRFEELAGAPDGTKLSRFRELAIQVVKAMCEPSRDK